MRRHWQKAFLAGLEETGHVEKSAAAAGIPKVTVYAHKRDDPLFAKEWELSLERGADALEAEARRRALEGVDKPVFHRGVQCGVIREYSDVLLIFLLKGLRPQKWRETRATIPPAELNRMIETELQRIAKQKETETTSTERLN